MAKQLIFSEEARRDLKKGIDTLAGAVKTTLGPKGRNVALDKKFGAPTITHDGVTVAKDIELEEPFENMGAQLLKEAATRTNDVAGDGGVIRFGALLARSNLAGFSIDDGWIVLMRIDIPTIYGYLNSYLKTFS